MNTDANRQVDEPNGDELTVPVPPRLWWLKRILVACAISLAALAAIRLWWGHVAHNRLQAEIERVRAAGEPIFPEDFDPPPVPDDENAALVISKAIKALVAPAEAANDISTLASLSQFTADELADAALIVSANADALRFARQARDLPQADMGLRIRTPAINWILPPLSGYRELARLLAVTARYRHQTGDDAGAVSAIRDLLALGNALDRQPTLISHLVAISVNALAVELVESIAPDLEAPGPHDDLGTDAEPARRIYVEDLVADLLDEQVMHRGLIRALQCERMFALDNVQLCADGKASVAGFAMFGGPSPLPFWDGPLGLLFRPLLELDGVELMRYGTAWVEAGRQPTWPALFAKRPPDPLANAGTLERLRRPLSAVLPPSLDRATQLHYRALANRRMAAVALAVRLYEIDRGSRPRRLADLALEYLDEVPHDPFGVRERPVGYRPDDDPPILYSIGPNGTDDGGAYSLRPTGGVRRDELDQPFFLNGERPGIRSDASSAPPPSERYAEEEYQEEKNEGNADEDQAPERQPKERQDHAQDHEPPPTLRHDPDTDVDQVRDPGGQLPERQEPGQQEESQAGGLMNGDDRQAGKEDHED